MLPQRIKKRRKDLGLTQDQLAGLINSRKSTISNYETGYSSPSGEVLKDLATALKTSVDYLLGRTEDPSIVSDSSKDLIKETQEKYAIQALNAINRMKYIQGPEETNSSNFNLRTAIQDALDRRNKLVHGTLEQKDSVNKSEVLLRAILLEGAVTWSHEELIVALAAVQSWKTTKKDIEDATEGLDEKQ